MRNLLSPLRRARHAAASFRSLSTAPSAIVLLSGGLDSATVLAMAVSEGHRVTTLSFDYKQRHRHELEAAAFQSTKLGAVDHRVAAVDPAVFAGSSLVDPTIAVPQLRSPEVITSSPPPPPPPPHAAAAAAAAPVAAIPNTYVPARNTLFLSYGLALAEALGATRIYIGANAVDYSGYPDCRPAFLTAFQTVADVGTRAGAEFGQAPRVEAPLLHLRKTDIIREGLRLGVNYADTHSCYDPGPRGRPCSRCDSCVLRAEAFAQLGFPVDPVVKRYQDEDETTVRT